MLTLSALIDYFAYDNVYTNYNFVLYKYCLNKIQCNAKRIEYYVHGVVWSYVTCLLALFNISNVPKSVFVKYVIVAIKMPVSYTAFAVTHLFSFRKIINNLKQTHNRHYKH